jgi:hypothetical protein
MKQLLYILLFLLLASCKKESYIAEGNYLNPIKDSVSFGYRLTDMYYTDLNSKETHVEFILDTSQGYFWREINIEMEANAKNKNYLPEYTGNKITKFFDNSPQNEDILITYKGVGTQNRSLLSTIIYKRKQNPLGFRFNYNSKSGLLTSISLHKLIFNEEIGQEIERFEFCENINLGSCSDSLYTESFQYYSDFNSLYYCNELFPLMLLFSIPNFNTLTEISPILPYYFSRKLAQSSILYKKGSYNFGLNKGEPTFLFFKPFQNAAEEGFQFSMRIY